MIDPLTNKWLLGLILIGSTIALACVFFIIRTGYKIFKHNMTNSNQQSIRSLV